jgi:hypothetical protein
LFFTCFDPIICNNDNVVCVNKRSMVLGLGMHVFRPPACSVFSRFYEQCSWKEHRLNSMIWTNFDPILCTNNSMRFG